MHIHPSLKITVFVSGIETTKITIKKLTSLLTENFFDFLPHCSREEECRMLNQSINQSINQIVVVVVCFLAMSIIMIRMMYQHL
jgi:hypothetical protein